MRGGASLGESPNIPEGFGIAPVLGVSGVATNRRVCAEFQEFTVPSGGSETATWHASIYLRANLHIKIQSITHGSRLDY